MLYKTIRIGSLPPCETCANGGLTLQLQKNDPKERCVCWADFREAAIRRESSKTFTAAPLVVWLPRFPEYYKCHLR